VGWEKVAYWSTKAAISLKRVKIEEKLLWKAYRNSQTLFRMVPPPTPYGLPFPKIGVRTPLWGANPDLGEGEAVGGSPFKIPIAIISGTGKAANFEFGQYIQRVHPNKSPLKFWRKSKSCFNFCSLSTITVVLSPYM